jgi:hypothetical protein
MVDVGPIEVQKALGGVGYPTDKEDLVQNAKKKDANDKVLSALKDLPEKKYESPADVNKDIF